MGKLADHWFQCLHPVNLYANFPYQNYGIDLQGGPEDPLFGRLIQRHRPSLIIEVGTWKGSSALQMASCIKEQDIDGAIICIDTWLGSLEHLTRKIPGWDLGQNLSYGYPTLYYQFVANVMHKGLQDLIVPLPTTSTIGARLLMQQKCQADLIYLDGSHDEEDVYQDVAHFWKLLRPGGLIFGDDWGAYWYGVICGVNRFVRENELNLQVMDTKWLLQKS